MDKFAKFGSRSHIVENDISFFARKNAWNKINIPTGFKNALTFKG